MRKTIPQGGATAYHRPPPKRRRARSLGRHDARARPGGRARRQGTGAAPCDLEKPGKPGGKARGAGMVRPNGAGSNGFWPCVRDLGGSGATHAPHPDARPDRGQPTAGTGPGVLARGRGHQRGGHQRASAPVLEEICPLPAHGRATSRMKKIKQRQYQRTKSRERAAGRSTSGHSGGRVAPPSSARLRGGAGRDGLSFRS